MARQTAVALEVCIKNVPAGVSLAKICVLVCSVCGGQTKTQVPAK